MLREIEAALPIVSPVCDDWRLVQDTVMETASWMEVIEALVKMTGSLEMENDLESITSLELTQTIPSPEVSLLFKCCKIKYEYLIIFKGYKKIKTYKQKSNLKCRWHKV